MTTLAARKRGITVFRAADSVDLANTDFMTRPGTMPEGFQSVRDEMGAGAAAGAEAKVLVRDAGGFSLVYLWFKPNYPLLRHSHDVDCMYYVISGSAVMGRQTLRAGDSFFVPARAPYQYNAGPDGVEVLEVRHGSEQFDIEVVPDPPRWRAMVEVVKANQTAWSELSTSPTFAANGG